MVPLQREVAVNAVLDDGRRLIDVSGDRASALWTRVHRCIVVWLPPSCSPPAEAGDHDNHSTVNVVPAHPVGPDPERYGETANWVVIDGWLNHSVVRPVEN